MNTHKKVLYVFLIKAKFELHPFKKFPNPDKSLTFIRQKFVLSINRKTFFLYFDIYQNSLVAQIQSDQNICIYRLCCKVSLLDKKLNN